MDGSYLCGGYGGKALIDDLAPISRKKRLRKDRAKKPFSWNRCGRMLIPVREKLLF